MLVFGMLSLRAAKVSVMKGDARATVESPASIEVIDVYSVYAELQ